MKTIYRMILAAVLLLLAAATFSSCADPVEDHVLPDGTYKIVFYSGADPVKVTFKGGLPTDPSHEAMFTDYENGVICRRLLPKNATKSFSVVESGYAIKDISDPNAIWECHRENTMDLIKPGETLYAEWETLPVYIEFVLDGKAYGNGSSTHEYYDTVKYPWLDLSKRSFLGWFDKNGVQYTDGTAPLYGMSVVDADFPFDRTTRRLTLYAHFQAFNMTVQLDHGAGHVEGFEFARDKEMKQSDLPVPTVENQEFVHWSDVPEGEAFEGMPRDGMTLYAVWKYYKPTVFHGGSVAGEQRFNVYLGNTAEPVLPVNPGYRFTGWYADPDCTGTPIEVSSMTYDGLLPAYYAGWVKTSYTLTFGGSAAGKFDAIVYQYGYGADSLPVMSVSGYIFEGWCIDSACATEPIKRIDPTFYGDYTLYPKLTPRTYSITLYDDAAGYPKTIEVTFGTIYNLGVPTQQGKTFKGWYTASGVQMTDENGRSLKRYENYEDIRLYAVYEEDQK